MGKTSDIFDFSLKKNKKVQSLFKCIKYFIDLENECMHDTLDYTFNISEVDDITGGKIVGIKGTHRYTFTLLLLFKYEKEVVSWINPGIRKIFKEVVTEWIKGKGYFVKIYKAHKEVFDALMNNDRFTTSDKYNPILLISLFYPDNSAIHFSSDEGQEFKTGIFGLIGIKNVKKSNYGLSDAFDNCI